jgi:hypothetical protein
MMEQQLYDRTMDHLRSVNLRIAAALAEHQASQGMCETCGTDYPCRTRRELIGNDE